MATDIDKLFQEADAAGHEAGTPDNPPANGATKAPTDLAAKVAAKRGKAGTSVKTPVPSGPASDSDAASTPLAATDGISPNAKDELAKLAQKQEAKAGKGKAKPAAPEASSASSD